MRNLLVHMMPAYAIHSDVGAYLGTIVPQDENCRVYIGSADMVVVQYGEEDQGDVIARIITDILEKDKHPAAWGTESLSPAMKQKLASEGWMSK